MMAEGAGIEPARPSLTGYGLASRPIASLATFHMADGEGFEPSYRGSHSISVFKTGAIAVLPTIRKTWCPTPDSNWEIPASKAVEFADSSSRAEIWCPVLDSNQEPAPFESAAYTNSANGAWWSDLDSNQNGTSRPAGYSRVLYRMSVRSKGDRASITRSCESGA